MENLRQQLYFMRLAAKPEAGYEQIKEILASMVVANSGCLPAGIDFYECQVVLNEEPVALEEERTLWKGVLLIDTLISIPEEQYKAWYWDDARRTQTAAWNQVLADGQDLVLWVELNAV